MYHMFACWALWTSAQANGEPIPLPLPTPMIIEQPMAPPMPMAFERTSMYKWQYYGVDRSGHFRARVVLDCPDPRYLYNGAPYPISALSHNQRDYIPMIQQ